jgi:hypothetical protein
MIKNILQVLPHCNGETENIRIAQGKNKLPVTLKDGYKQLVKEIQWLRKK